MNTSEQENKTRKQSVGQPDNEDSQKSSKSPVAKKKTKESTASNIPKAKKSSKKSNSNPRKEKREKLKDKDKEKDKEPRTKDKDKDPQEKENGKEKEKEKSNQDEKKREERRESDDESDDFDVQSESDSDTDSKESEHDEGDTQIQGRRISRLEEEEEEGVDPELKKILSEWNSKDKIPKIVQVQAQIRGYVNRKSYKQKLKMYAKRNRIVEEMLTTEKTYVSNLGILLQNFLQPLSEAAAAALATAPANNSNNANFNIIALVISSGVMTRKKKSHIDNALNDIRVILGYNSIILKDLQNRITAWSPIQKLGDIFIKMGDFMKTYIQYMQHYEKLLVSVGKMSFNSTFATCMESLRVTTTLGNQGLKDFLIIPVQRIPRYILLLKDLVNNTWKEHPDYQQLTNALQKITSIAQIVDKSQENAMNINKVTAVQASISGKLTEGLKLVQPSRRFVREGDIPAILDSHKERPLHIILFNDLLLWSKPKKKGVSTSVLYDLITVYNLLDITKIAEIEHGNKYAISLYTKDRLSFLLFESIQDRSGWANDLKNYIDQCTNRAQFLKSTLTPRSGIDSFTVSASVLPSLSVSNPSDGSVSPSHPHHIPLSCSSPSTPTGGGSFSANSSPSSSYVAGGPLGERRKKRNSKIMEMKQRLSGSLRRRTGGSGIKEELSSAPNVTLGADIGSSSSSSGSSSGSSGGVSGTSSTISALNLDSRTLQKRRSLGADLFNPPSTAS